MPSKVQSTRPTKKSFFISKRLNMKFERSNADKVKKARNVMMNFNN